MVGQAEPSLFEVLHSKPVSALCSLYHKSEEQWVREMQLKALTDELMFHKKCLNILQFINRTKQSFSHFIHVQ